MPTKKAKQTAKEARRRQLLEWFQDVVGSDNLGSGSQQRKNPLQLPEVMEHVFKQMDAVHLRSARRVSKFWNSLAVPVIRTRAQTVKLNGPNEIDGCLHFLQQPESAEFRRWNLKYEITAKFTWKFEEALRKLKTIVGISGPNCVEGLTIFGDYFFKANRYAGLTPSLITLVDAVAPGLKRITVNDNTSSNKIAHSEPFADIVEAFLLKAPNLTHLIFDHSDVWTVPVRHNVYDMLMIRLMSINLQNLQHLELLLTDPQSYAALQTIALPKLTHFVLCLDRKFKPDTRQQLSMFLESMCPALKSLEIENHGRIGKKLSSTPLFVWLPNLCEFGEIDRVNESRIGRIPPWWQPKAHQVLPIEAIRMECVRVNIAAVIMNGSSRIHEANKDVRSLLLQIDGECTRFELTPKLAQYFQKRLGDFARGFPNVNKLTIDIRTFEPELSEWFRMLLSAFGGSTRSTHVESLDLRNYHVDMLGDLVASEPEGSRVLTALKSVREIIIPAFDSTMKVRVDIEILNQFMKNKWHLEDFRVRPGMCRLDLNRILALGAMPALKVVRLPSRFGFSWIPDSPTFMQARDMELAKVQEQYPNIEIKFL